jgi:hypothetical protein
MMPKTTSIVATIQRERSVVSISSWKRMPSTTIGTEPTMMSHPMRASGSLRGTLPVNDPNQCETMRTMSRQKKTTTAVSVPSWVIAVNAAPGS